MLDDYKDLILDESLTTIVSETKQLKSKQKKNHILSVMVQMDTRKFIVYYFITRSLGSCTLKYATIDIFIFLIKFNTVAMP